MKCYNCGSDDMVDEGIAPSEAEAKVTGLGENVRQFVCEKCGASVGVPE